MRKWILLISFIILLVPGCGKSKTAINTTDAGLAIKGYDTVAYFTLGKPVKGKQAFANVRQGATWLFSSQKHLDIFIGNPDKYIPKYGGYWAYAVSRGTTADIDPFAWTIHQGKLYLNLNPKIQKNWLKAMEENIVKADKNWPNLIPK